MFKFKRTIFYDMLENAVLKKMSPIFDEDIKKTLGLLCTFSMVNKNYITHLSNILNNQFTTDFYKSLCLDFYCIAKKQLNCLKNLVKAYRIKRLPLKNINDIGGLENINNIKSHLKFYLIDKDSKYCFKFSDIVCIINTALLTNTADFYSEPILIKNPYTNLPFSISSLYNIYFNLKKSTFLMPTLFDLYMKSNFNIVTFANDYETVIRDILIKKYIDNLTFNNYIKEIKKMFKDSKIIGLKNSDKLKKIDPKMPSDIIFKVFKPFVNIYIYITYTLNNNKKFVNKNLLYKKITGFVNENPKFGRKIISTKKNRTDMFVFSGLLFNDSPYITDIKNDFQNINIENINTITNVVHESPPLIFNTGETIYPLPIPVVDTVFVLDSTPPPIPSTNSYNHNNGHLNNNDNDNHDDNHDDGDIGDNHNDGDIDNLSFGDIDNDNHDDGDIGDNHNDGDIDDLSFGDNDSDDSSVLNGH